MAGAREFPLLFRVQVLHLGLFLFSAPQPVAWSELNLDEWSRFSSCSSRAAGPFWLNLSWHLPEGVEPWVSPTALLFATGG